MGNNLRVMAQDSVHGIDIGIVTILKLRVVTVSGIGQAYFLKHWKATEQEPIGWSLVGLEDTTNPRHGSMLLYAHHVKGIFGKVSIQPLGQEIVVTNVESLSGPNSAYVTWKTNAKSTGTVLYGKSLASPDTAAGDTLASTVHHVLLPDLTPSTQYQVRVEATAADGGSIRQAQSSFTTRASQPPLAFRSDTFDSTAIDGTRWLFINPDPASTLSLVRDNSNQAVSIAIPSGSGHDIWAGMNAPQFMQPGANMDFQAEAKFLSLPTLQYQDQGILVEQDFENLIRIDFFSDTAGVYAFTASFEGGIPTVRGKVQVAAQSPLFLRLTRTADLWKAFYSHDSVNWNLASSFTSAMRMNAIGLYGGNAPGQDGTAPAFTSIIDHFINLVEKANDVPLTPSQVPLSFALEQNFPNPFNPKTGVRFQVSGVSDVKITVYDVLGREVTVLVNERKTPGTYEVSFDGSGLASGTYICRMGAGAFVQTRTMVLLK